MWRLPDSPNRVRTRPPGPPPSSDSQQPPSTAAQSMMNTCRSRSPSSQAAFVHSTVRSLCTTSVPWQWSTSRSQSTQLLMPSLYQLHRTLEAVLRSACRPALLMDLSQRRFFGGLASRPACAGLVGFFLAGPGLAAARRRPPFPVDRRCFAASMLARRADIRSSGTAPGSPC